MSPIGEFLVALAIAAGLLGIVVPLLPGLVLEVVAILIWAAVVGDAVAWGVAILCFAIGALGTIFKYLVPGRRLKESGMPLRTLVIAGGVGVVGFFAIPVVGAPIGFIGAIYVAERIRVGSELAWPATKTSLGAVAASFGIELVTGLVVAGIWFAAVLLT
ncbi:MAG: DUF456 domain-containing protein [Actinomycetota bacterium]|nr:DUF456 domain-containing protein [Actinomycetota bacterium]